MPPARDPLVLLVDRPTAVDGLTGLRGAGYAVRTVAPDRSAAERAAVLRPHLAVLSMDALGADGLPTVVELRARLPLLPVVLVKRDANAADRVQGLSAGADDFWPWPLGSDELAARIQAILRRAGTASLTPRSTEMRAGPLVVDEAARSVEIFGALVQLTMREFDLLAFLLHHARQALRREVLLRAVWGYSFGDASTVTVHVRRLRTKVEPQPSRPTAIRTVWGVGYLFDPAGAAAWLPPHDRSSPAPTALRPAASPVGPTGDDPDVAAGSGRPVS